MLDFLRRSATSVFAWLILGVLALAFGLSFGLPSFSLTLGPEKYVKVHGEGVGDEEFRYEIALAGRYGRIPKEPETQEAYGAREEVLEGVIERILLAKTAKDLGLGATEREAEDLVLDGHVILFGFTLEFLGPKDEFNYKLFKNNWLRPLGIAEQRYLEYQQEEYLARTLRDVIRVAAAVPEPELRKQYEARANQISLRYARYEAMSFGQLYDPTEADIDAYVEANGDALAADFATQSSRFVKLGKQMRVYVVEVPKAGDDDGDDEGGEDGADDGADDGETEGAAGDDGGDDGADEGDADDPRAKIDAAKARIAGGEDFRAVARAVSRHTSARGGGDLGWVGENLGTGLDPVVDEAARGAELDSVSDVLEGESSYFLVRVTGRREGDVPEADAYRELAAEALRKQKGRELAKAAAEEDKAAVLTDGKSVSEVFASPDALGDTPFGTPLEDVPIEGDDTAPGGRDKVAMRESGLTPKGQPIKGLGGPAPKLVDAAWADESGADLLDDVYEVGDDYVLAGVVTKVSGTDEEYAEQRKLLYSGLSRQHGEAVSARFAERLCLEAKASGDLVVSESKVKTLMTYDTTEQAEEKEDPEDPQRKPYAVCQRVGNRGGVLTAQWKFAEWR